MTASELLSDLRERGVKLWVEGTDLRFSAPKGALGFGATQLLARHKSELVRLLKSGPESDVSKRPAARASRGFSLDTDVIAVSSVANWSIEEQAPYVRYVAPYKGFLYQRLALDKTFVRGEGCHLFDEHGTRYADFIAQFGAVPFGHDPDLIWRALEAVRREAQPNLVIASISKAAGELAEKLVAVAPPGLEHVVFTNSGAEAVEAAIKLARCRTGRIGILSTRNGFHGLTLAGMSATGKEFFQRGFGAPAPGFNYVPFGDVAALLAMLEMRPDFFAAFVLEVIQGESGIHVAPPGYVAAARDLCDRYGVLLIVDEVQTGLGRTGSLFACTAEQVTPDVLLLGKALGGGLMPVGACLYSRKVYSEHFDLRHGSTFAGNALACAAARATIDALIDDDQRLVRHVAMIGDRLQDQLRQLQNEYPTLISEIRGRGLMLGLELDLSGITETQNGVLAVMQEQGLLLYMAVSYLLNVAHVRVAPSLTDGTVLRIEPPLIADAPLCAELIDGLRRSLDLLQRGDAGELLGHLMGGTQSPGRVPAAASKRNANRQSWPTPRMGVESDVTRFAFVAHLLGVGDLRRFDPTLERFGDRQLEELRSRITEFVKPFPLNEHAVQSTDGKYVEGESIVLPHLPSELLALSGKEAVDLVQSCVDLAADRGAEVIGLGGFSSIIADGGLALRTSPEAILTSGNSMTTWAAIRAVEAACAEHAIALADSTVAIVGATGAIGHALSLLCAERVGHLILIGNPRGGPASLKKLEDVAQQCERHIASLAAAGRAFPAGSYAERATRRATRSAAAVVAGEPDITTTTDIDQKLPKADIVLAATNAVVPFISARHLRQGALVCDLSRPYNLAIDLDRDRPDLRIVEGGLVQAPNGSCLEDLGGLETRDRPNVILACAAETIILALSGYRSRHLCGRLDIATIQEIGHLAEDLGFSVVN